MLLMNRPNSDDISHRLAARAEARRIIALQNIRQDQQARLGQYFTPEHAARLVASFPELPKSGHIRILDPGAGSGALLAALSARIIRECSAVTLHLVAVEVDDSLTPLLKETLEDVVTTSQQSGINVGYDLIEGDYIESRPGVSDLLHTVEPFDLVIMNPPYQKLGRTSKYRRSLAQLGIDCPNLYAGFLALGTLGLREGGQLVAITPRSFANGPYFDQFRGFLLSHVALDRIHVFESRSTVFSDTGVLQENVVFSATRSGTNTRVFLSTSHGHRDKIVERSLAYSEVVKPDDRHQFIRLPVEESDTATAQVMADMPARLGDIGVQVSTGRVVDFRCRECLQETPQQGSHPLIYPANVRGGRIEWPRKIRKDQGFTVRDPKDEKLLLPEGYYVVVKRFSAKEERRRVVGAVWDPSGVPGPVAFENHLNVFHSDGAGLPRDLAVGLSYWLNSSIVDRFFRTFSGHTQVNATDLRSLRYPSRIQLMDLGSTLSANLPPQEVVDSRIATMLNELERFRVEYR